MKANAPEKLYFGRHEGSLLDTYSKKEAEDEIEYVRTDVIIEKAEKYLKDKCQRFILTEKDIEDFKNYMKEE